MKQKLLLTTLLALCTIISASAFGKTKMVKITVEPKEAAIYVDNTFMGNGFAEFPCPKRKMPSPSFVSSVRVTLPSTPSFTVATSARACTW